jgi:hypothetical protein
VPSIGRRRKTITRKKNNNHKMNEKCSVGSSREVILLPDIFASSSHTAVTATIPKIIYDAITRRRYESRLVKSKNRNKIRASDLFSIIELFMIYFACLLFQALVCFGISGEALQ